MTDEIKRPRGRPRKPTAAGKVAELRLRDQLQQLEADSPPVAEAETLLEPRNVRASQVFRMIAAGQAVVISRGILRAILAELGK